MRGTVRNRLRLAATHATLTGAHAVRTCFDLAGATATDRQHPLARCLRDGTILAHHAAANTRTYDLFASVALGLVQNDPRV